ncbi:hypothetical protein HDU93_007937 [Gonapodya sp. JEL0774]|nr:hypothetical protein HDU93_007937 [Gonapodya sp. JEL0774]
MNGSSVTEGVQTSPEPPADTVWQIVERSGLSLGNVATLVLGSLSEPVVNALRDYVRKNLSVFLCDVRGSPLSANEILGPLHGIRQFRNETVQDLSRGRTESTESVIILQMIEEAMKKQMVTGVLSRNTLFRDRAWSASALNLLEIARVVQHASRAAPLIWSLFDTICRKEDSEENKYSQFQKFWLLSVAAIFRDSDVNFFQTLVSYYVAQDIGLNRRMLTLLNHLGVTVSLTTATRNMARMRLSIQARFKEKARTKGHLIRVIHDNINVSTVQGAVLSWTGAQAASIDYVSEEEAAKLAIETEPQRSRSEMMSTDLIATKDQKKETFRAMVKAVMRIVARGFVSLNPLLDNIEKDVFPYGKIVKTSIWPLWVEEFNQATTAGFCQVLLSAEDMAVTPILSVGDELTYSRHAGVKLIRSDEPTVAGRALIVQLAMKFLPPNSNVNSSRDDLAICNAEDLTQLATKVVKEMHRKDSFSPVSETPSADRKEDKAERKSKAAQKRTLEKREGKKKSSTETPFGGVETSTSSSQRENDNTLLNNGNRDYVWELAMRMCRILLLWMLMRKAVRYGQNRLVLNLWILWLPIFIGAGRTRYTRLTVNVLAMYLCELPPTLAQTWLRNLSVNLSGWQGGFVPDNLMQEHFNRLIKALLRAGMSIRSKNFQNLVVSSVEINELGNKLEEGMGIRMSSEKRRTQLAAQTDQEVRSLLRELESQDLFTKHKDGRMLPSGGEMEIMYPDCQAKGVSKFHKTVGTILREGSDNVEPIGERQSESQGADTGVPDGDIEDGRQGSGSDENEDNYVDEVLEELDRE